MYALDAVEEADITEAPVHEVVVGPDGEARLGVAEPHLDMSDVSRISAFACRRASLIERAAREPLRSEFGAGGPHTRTRCHRA